MATSAIDVKSIFEGLDDADLKPVDTPAGMTIELLPHQKQGVAWMSKKEKGTTAGGLLADQMGMGKVGSARLL